MLYFRRMTVLIVILSMCFSNIACTTMKPISMTAAASVAAQIKAGDKIEYRKASGATGELRVVSVDDEMIQGKSRGQHKTVMIADIESIKKQKVDQSKTAMLVLAVLVVGGLGILMDGMSGDWDFFKGS